MSKALSLDTICAALCYAMGVEPPRNANTANEILTDYIDSKLGSHRADRVFMYNPDAIGRWVYEKYPDLFSNIESHSEVSVPLVSVQPIVTPACFATMYTGAQPAVHGIQKPEKKIIKTDSLFDALIRAGKKPVIVAADESSMSKIFCERDMDYFVTSTMDEANAVMAELITKDEHDFYALYNGNFDCAMHKHGPESVYALAEIRSNARIFAMFSDMIKKSWKGHDTLVGFAMDHGCQDMEGGGGTHWPPTPEDLNITHFYNLYTKQI